MTPTRSVWHRARDGSGWVRRRLRRATSSVGFQVLVLFAGAVLIPVGVSLAQIQADLRDAQQRATEQAVSAAHVAAAQLSTNLVELYGFGSTVSQFPEFWTGTDADRDRILTALVAPYNSLERVSYFTADFQEHGRTAHGTVSMHTDFSQRAYAREAVATNGLALASQRVRAEDGDVLLLPVAFPVTEQGGTHQSGFISASLRLAGPMSLWKEQSLPPESTVLLLDARTSNVLGATRDQAVVRMQGVPEGVRAGETTVRDATGAEHFWAWHRVGADLPWTAAVDVPADIVLAPGRAQALTRTLGAVGTAALLTLILAIVGRGQYPRLLQLRAAAREWARGSWAHRSGVVGHDEIGLLGVAFDAMALQAGEFQRTSREQLQRVTELASEVATSEHLLRSLYDAMACGVVVLTADGRTQRSNPAAETILGLTANQLRAHRLWDLCAPVEADGSPLDPANDPLTQTLENTPVVRGRTLGITRHGEQRWVEMDVVRTVAAAGEVRLVLSFLDITDRKLAEAKLTFQALHDSLTGLPNRPALLDRLQNLSLSATRDNTPLAVLMLDLDRFKDINDRLGHAAGDALLYEVGRRLTTTLRGGDIAARMGGDEYVVVLPATGLDEAIVVAERMGIAIGLPIALDARDVEVTASIGIAMLPDHATDGETLLRHADTAMYRAKKDHLAHVVYDPQDEDAGARRLVLMTDLRHALANDELWLAYQPKIDCQTGAFVGVEALVRWQHAELGVIAPDEFISLAEDAGLIKGITHWVLDAALRQCSEWRDRGLRVPVAVNLSAQDVQDLALPRLIITLLARSNLPPTWLKVELTESSLMADPSRAMRVLQELGDVGVRVSIDDFGTGYSSLAYLRQLPIHEIKIDRCFVNDMLIEDKDLAIVRSTIELGHNLGLEVVAEGVENQATLSTLAELGCDLAQGYFVSRPLSAVELTLWRQKATGAGPEASTAWFDHRHPHTRGA